MGTYTQIAKVGADASAQRRRYSSVHRPTGGERSPTAPAPYVCPSCDDESVVESSCGRCGGVRMVARARSVALRRHAASGGESNGPTLGTAILFGGPLLAVAITLLAIAGGSAALSFVGATSAVGGFLILGMGARHQSRAARARWRRVRARRASARTPSTALREIGSAPAPVRQRGRLRVETLHGAPALVLVTEDGARIRVPVGPELRAYDRREERTLLEDGERVDLVGHARRVPGGLEGYRALEGELELDRGAPAVVWVEG